MSELIKPMNERAQQMWNFIEPHVMWRGTSVIDYGVGYGDLLAGARAEGAICFAVDRQLNDFRAGCERRGESMSEYVTNTLDIDKYAPRRGYDVAFCCSVLPYLVHPDMLLTVMADISVMSFIECQYYGDGPGTVKDDHEMKLWLERYWTFVLKIGSTHVKGRNTHRSIWKCIHGE